MSNIAFMQLIENVEDKPEEKANTLVKVSFEDGYVLQGVFNSQEKFKNVVEFVKENLE